MGRRSADGGSRFPPPYPARVIDLSIGAILSDFQPCLVFYIHSPIYRRLESLKTGKNRLFRFCVLWCLVWRGCVLEYLPLFHPYFIPIYPPIFPGQKQIYLATKNSQPRLWFCWSPRYRRTLPVLQFSRYYQKIGQKKETFLGLLFTVGSGLLKSNI